MGKVRMGKPLLRSWRRDEGKRKSRQRCAHCKVGWVTMLAKRYGDPFCSRVCMEKAFGIVHKTYDEEGDTDGSRKRAEGAVQKFWPASKRKARAH